MRAVNAMVIDFKSAGEPGTRAEFTYHMTPATISITGKGRLSVGKDLEAVLRKIGFHGQVRLRGTRLRGREQCQWLPDRCPRVPEAALYLALLSGERACLSDDYPGVFRFVLRCARNHGTE